MHYCVDCLVPTGPQTKASTNKRELMAEAEKKHLTEPPHCCDINRQLMQFNFSRSCWSFQLPSNTKIAESCLKIQGRLKHRAAVCFTLLSNVTKHRQASCGWTETNCAIVFLYWVRTETTVTTRTKCVILRKHTTYTKGQINGFVKSRDSFVQRQK